MVVARPRAVERPEDSPAPGAPRRRAVGLPDVLLPVSVGLWLFALHGTKPDAVNDWGLLAALPIMFYVALGLLVCSIGIVLTDDRTSPVRLGLHLVALVVLLHGTVPLIFPETNYPWAYKHMGVVGYINRHGRLDSSVDIYQNWPGFFTVAALFDRIAGVDSPLAYAKWAPVYFNLLLCLELAFVLRSLSMRRRERWLALFVFVTANWVGQDYFAPQALSLVLSLAVYGMVLAWMQVDRRPALVRAVGRLAQRLVGTRVDPAPVASPGSSADPTSSGPGLVGPTLAGSARALSLALVFAVFAVVVVSHQLSPYLVVFGVALCTAAGLIRPRWVVVGLGLLTIAYLVPHLPYLRNSHNLSGSPLNPRDILNALSNPFDNAQSSGFDGRQPLPGRSLTALGAPALILGMWVLATIGAFRRLRAGRPVLLLVLLTASPAFLAFGQNYGGEAIFRIYLFSLPWAATLASSALAPRSGRWSRLRGGMVAVALVGVAALFLSSFYGSIELYRVRPGAVAATRYFYDHAEPGSVLGLGAPNVPARVAANYDEFLVGSTPPPLTEVTELQGHRLGAGDLPTLSRLYQQHFFSSPGKVYLSLSADQDVYAEVLGYMPKGSIAGLDRALADSPQWRVFFRNRDAVIYEFVPDGAPSG